MDIARSHLHAALRTHRLIGSNRGTLPVLSNVLVSMPEAGAVTLESTNLESLIRTVTHAGTGEPLTTTIPRAWLTQIVNALPKQATMSVNVGQSRRTIVPQKGGKKVLSSAPKALIDAPNLQCEQYVIGAEQWPSVNFADGPVVVSYPTASLRAALQAAVLAAEDDAMSRPILGGVHWVVGEDSTRLEGTDGFRFHRLTAPSSVLIQKPDAALPNFVLGKPSAILLIRALAQAPEKMVMQMNANGMVAFTWWGEAPNQTTIIARLIEGSYPDLNRVMPKAFLTTVTVDRAALSYALLLARVGGDNADNCRFTFADGWFSLAAVNSENDGAACQVSVPRNGTLETSGEQNAVALSFVFLEQILAACRSETVTLSLNEPLHPVVVTGSGAHALQAVVMPMHVVDLR